MSESMARKLNDREHIIAEQGLLNLALQNNVQILSEGVDITLALITAAPRVNSQFDTLHAPSDATPAIMPGKKQDLPPVRTPKVRPPRKATAKAGPPRAAKA